MGNIAGKFELYTLGESFGSYERSEIDSSVGISGGEGSIRLKVSEMG